MRSAVRVRVAGLALATALVQPLLGPGERASLQLSPSSGGPDTQITAVVRVTSAFGCRATGASFSFDGVPVGDAVVDQGSCQAASSFTPPPGHQSRGRHQVVARVVSGTSTRLAAQAVFTIDPKAGGAAASAVPTGSASPLPAPPTIVVPTNADPPTVAAAPAGGRDSGGGIGLGYLLGLLVLLLGAGGAGYLIYQLRRDRTRDGGPGGDGSDSPASGYGVAGYPAEAATSVYPGTAAATSVYPGAAMPTSVYPGAEAATSVYPGAAAATGVPAGAPGDTTMPAAYPAADPAAPTAVFDRSELLAYGYGPTGDPAAGRPVSGASARHADPYGPEAARGPEAAHGGGWSGGEPGGWFGPEQTVPGAGGRHASGDGGGYQPPAQHRPPAGYGSPAGQPAPYPSTGHDDLDGDGEPEAWRHTPGGGRPY